MGKIVNTAKKILKEDKFKKSLDLLKKLEEFYDENECTKFRVYAYNGEYVMVSMICEDLEVIGINNRFTELCLLCDKVEFVEGGGDEVGDCMVIGFTLYL